MLPIWTARELNSEETCLMDLERVKERQRERKKEKNAVNTGHYIGLTALFKHVRAAHTICLDQP
jgi:hypothetical protein